MLHNIQKLFLEGLFNQEQSPDIVSVISEHGSRSAVDQFMSYRDSVVGGMIEALSISYPVVKNLVGEQFFNHISYQYICNTPSISPDLNEYGQSFSDFIDTLKSTALLPYLSDVAKLEWAWQNIINGYNSEPGNLHLLGELTDEQNSRLIFQLNPHSSLLKSNYPVHTIWEINQDDSKNTEIQIENDEFNLFIWRKELNMRIAAIDLEQWIFLSLINQELLFTDVCEEFNKIYPEFDIGTILAQCIQSGWIYSYKLK